jgi:hypothetical protein
MSYNPINSKYYALVVKINARITKELDESKEHPYMSLYLIHVVSISKKWLRQYAIFQDANDDLIFNDVSKLQNLLFLHAAGVADSQGAILAIRT